MTLLLKDPAGETFALIDPGALSTFAIPQWATGSVVTAAARNVAGSAIAMTVAGESLRPLSPVAIAAVFQPNEDLSLSWTRRSRRGWAWIDGIDAPLGECSERYRITLIGSSGQVEFECGEPALTIAAADLVPAGAGPATIEICQVGDFGASHPAQTSIIIP